MLGRGALVSRAQRNTSRACTPVFAGHGGALQTRDRSSLWRSRISGAPLHFVTRCTASGTRDSVGRVRSLIHFSNSPSRSRGAFLRPGFATLLHSPRTRGGRSAEKRSGACEAPVRHAVTRHVRRLRGALRPVTRDARLSALHRGDFSPGAALPSPALPPDPLSELLAAGS